MKGEINDKKCLCSSGVLMWKPGYEVVARIKKHVDQDKESRRYGSYRRVWRLFRFKCLSAWKIRYSVSGTDGVGTESALAIQANKHDHNRDRLCCNVCE